MEHFSQGMISSILATEMNITILSQFRWPLVIFILLHLVDNTLGEGERQRFSSHVSNQEKTSHLTTFFSQANTKQSNARAILRMVQLTIILGI
jgi:hypothetical protein